MADNTLADEHLFIELHSVYFLGVLSLLLSLLGALRQSKGHGSALFALGERYERGSNGRVPEKRPADGFPAP